MLAAALGLRLWGTGFGLPERFHPDEPAYVLQALAVARGLPNGLTFADPPLYKYVLLGEYALAFGVERVAGGVHSAQEFVDEFRADPSRLYLIARVSTAVIGTATVAAVGVLANALGSRRAGLIAAGLAAVTFALVRESHFGVDDALVTLLATLGLACSVRVARDGTRRDYLAAGALTGLAFAAKYDGIALVVPLVLARRPDRNVAFAALACVVAAVAAFPSLITETGRVLNDIYVHDYLEAGTGYDGLDPSGGYVFYARALAIGLGWPLLLGVIAGVFFSRDRRRLVVLSLPVALLLVLGSQRLYFARFALPAIPALIVLASLALDAMFRWRLLVGVLALLVVAAPTLTDSVRFDQLLTQTDTRTLARGWIDAELPADATIAVDMAPLGPTLDGLNVSVANDWSLFDLTPEDYVSRGIDYVVVSSFTSEARAVEPEREARRVAFYSALPQKATLVAQFRPYVGATDPPFAYDDIYGPYSALDQRERPGPTIWIYRLTR